MDEAVVAGSQQYRNSPSRNRNNERSVEEASERGIFSAGDGQYLSDGQSVQTQQGYRRDSPHTSNPQTGIGLAGLQQAVGFHPSHFDGSNNNNSSSQTSFNMNSMIGGLPDQSCMNQHAYQMQQQQQQQQQHMSPYSSDQLHQRFQQNQVYHYQHHPMTPHGYSMITPQQAYNPNGPIQASAGYNASWIPSQGPYMYYPQAQGQVDHQGQHAVYAANMAGSQGLGRHGAQGMEGQRPDAHGRRHAHPGYNSDQTSRTYSNPGVTAPSPRSLQLSIPRGPPRKPKQSGNALWVGNLPPGTNIVDLKDHFSKVATKDIESVFLISKSNCAFVNYRTESSCSAAMTRFHDSKFNGVRLVCRLRRSAASPSAGALPVSLETTPPSGNLESPVPLNHSSAPNILESAGASTGRTEDGAIEALGGIIKPEDRIFVVKSLTVEDLELSVRNGIWATQSHNEEPLNEAFAEAKNVYLIFSANKSGEYFGYAKMKSAIKDDPSMQNEWTPQKFSADAADLPKAISTQATATAPKGRIIDDSSRGTIFWEAENDEDSDNEADGEQDKAAGKDSDAEAQDDSSFEKAWGKPFRVEWISTNRLPFFRTRGLRNSWNANREVKIARDGTELETGVGRRLLEIFHRPGQQNSVQSNQPQNRSMLAPVN